MRPHEILPLLILATAGAVASEPAPLRLGEASVLTVRAPEGGLSPAERVRRGEEAIALGLGEASCGPEGFQLAAAGASIEILLCGRRVLAVNAEDAAAEGASVETTAGRWRDALRAEFDSTKRRRYGETLLQSAILGLLLPLLGLALALALRAATLRIQARILAVKNGGVQAGPLHLLSTDGERRFLVGMIGLLRLALYVILAYAFLVLFFRQLPWTRDVAAAMLAPFGELASETIPGIIAFLPRLVALVVVVAALRLAFRALDGLTAQAREGKVRLGPLLSPETAFVAGQTAKIVLLVAGSVIGALLLPGVGRQILLGALAAAGLAMAFGAREAAADLLAGLSILYGRPFRTGDRVRMGSVDGRVERKGIMHTFVRGDGGDLHLVPNRVVLSDSVTIVGPCRVLAGTVVAESARGVEAIVALLRHAGAAAGCRREAGTVRAEGMTSGRLVFRVSWPLPSGSDPAAVRADYLRALTEHAARLEVRIEEFRFQGDGGA